MRLLGLGLVLLSGCGLLLDLDPPDGDAGPRVDSGDFDAAQGDVRLVDASVVDADLMDAAVFDVGPPFDGGACETPADCNVQPECSDVCEDGRCIRMDEDEDGICDALDCVEGEIEYRDLNLMCASRSLEICRDSSWVGHDFDEVETCGDTDRNCDGTIDEFLGVLGCGVGECAGRRDCGESCLGESMATEACSDGGGFALDEDCDGRVDEGCAPAFECTRVPPEEEFVISGPGDYCLDVGDCTESVDFALAGDLSGIRIHGDMRRVEAGEFEPCDASAQPRSRVVVGSSLVITGNVQATNVRFEAYDELAAPTLIVESGEFRGHSIVVRGRLGSAFVVNSGATLHLSDARVSSSTDGHTIDSEGRVVIESSCSRRPAGTRCPAVDNGSIDTSGIVKLSAGNSVIHLSGLGSSLEMTGVRVRGDGSTAIWAENSGAVRVHDSVIIASSSRDAILLEECTGGIIRDSFVFNEGGEAGEESFGVHSENCAMRFAAPNVRPAPGSAHIIGSTSRNTNATGVLCGDGCEFEDMVVMGVGPRALPSLPGTSIGVECGESCDVVRSALAGNASVDAALTATGLQIGGGTVLRSRVVGGNAVYATGLLNSGGRALVHVQDSVAIGFVNSTTVSIASFEGRGVLLEETSNFSALHSTFAARTWVRTSSPATLCRGLEAAAGTRVRLVSSLLWAPCLGDALSYDAREDNLVLLDHVGAAASSNSFIGVTARSTDFGFIEVLDVTSFSGEYSGGAGLPVGPFDMTTEMDVDGVMRDRPSSIGAFN
ncbi:MAG: hypothetical protein ACI9KE_006054 [Polyangiales bacterium]|jgi:hypothetical protein